MEPSPLIRFLLGLREKLIKEIAIIDRQLSNEGWEVKESRIGRVRSTRGRKSMGPEERLEVSQRMKKYYAAKRAAKTNGTS